MTETPEEPANDFAAEAEGRNASLVAEFWEFLKHNKKWWLTPIILAILILGLLVIGLAGNALGMLARTRGRQTAPWLAGMLLTIGAFLLLLPIDIHAKYFQHGLPITPEIIVLIKRV